MRPITCLITCTTTLVVACLAAALSPKALSTETFADPLSASPYDATPWDAVMPYSTDVSYADSPHPLRNSPAYGDTPKDVQCLLDTNLNAPGTPEFKRVINAKPSWVPAKDRRYNRDIIETALEEFLTTSGLQAKGYYILMSKLLTYDQNIDSSKVLMKIKTCVYKPNTFSAKVIDFNVLYVAKSETKYDYHFNDAHVTGIIQDAYINKTAYRRWTS